MPGLDTTEGRPVNPAHRHPEDPHRDAPYANYTTVHGPRPLQASDLADATLDPDDDGTSYYAISREDGVLGDATDHHDPVPKIRVLYVTRDGSRGFVRWHHATEAAEAFAFDAQFHAVVTRPSGTGQRHEAPATRARFRERVTDLYPELLEEADT